MSVNPSPAPAPAAGPPVTVPIARRHHLLVRLAHWALLPLLAGLVASGLSIYWAAPVFTHPFDPATGTRDWVGTLGVRIARLLGDTGGDPRAWIYDHFGLGTRALATALRLHWALAYPFMAAGLVYALGLVAGGGWRALRPRRGDLAEAAAMLRYYLGAPLAALRRRPWPHPPVAGKYNALQRAAYLSVPVFGLLVGASGWAMHKPVSLGWLERAFWNYDVARVVHFVSMAALVLFALPHVVMVALDGFDTFRAMVTGWSKRLRHPEAGPAPARRSPLAEPRERIEHAPARALGARTRRDFLLFSAGALATGLGAWWLLPDRTRRRLLPAPGHDLLDTLVARAGLTRERREAALDRALTFDDDVAEALYSRDRRARTYARSQASRLRNNYAGRTPGPEYLAGWRLHVTGLAGGAAREFTAGELLARFPFHEQVTRLVCVEGWSAVAWWGGIRFADFIAAFPPGPGARWAAMRSAVNLDARGNPDPYYVSLDFDTALHPQVLLATHLDGAPLTVAHGAPLRLVAPMKLGLKNIKALTDLAWTAREPADYWAERGYSKYDGL